ncbi:DNA cytosine methyltransferase [Peribacillus asahii]|uniref:DNA cytosine methyltransferase n=1 Tax=Peribacillus asahii TaxID=228899 RepID=UPI00207984D2|nr:DNA cytosine methyltransferase [Peribacillus asahii]USK62244.1 DNA cytosine methyltransferase [Peribacillus asahii]
MELKFKKVYTVSSKNDPETPRIWLQSLVCKQAGFEKGQELYVSINETDKEIVIQNTPLDSAVSRVKVSGRTVNNTEQPYVEPLVDTASKKYQRIIRVRQKVEINVYQGEGSSRIVVRPLKFKLLEKETFVKSTDERISMLSICSGAGFGSAHFEECGYFKSIGAVELEDDSVETYSFNFPGSYIFNGDIRDCMTIPKSDVALVTMPCNESSSLGERTQGIMNDLLLATSEIIKATESRIVFFENVPAWYKTEGYGKLKSLLKEDFPYWQEKQLESYDFGSIARRNRKYACAFRNQEDFMAFQFPTPPQGVKRKKLREFLNKAEADTYEWKSVENWLSNFKERGDKGGAYKDRSLEKTFVKTSATELNCVPKRYTSQTASNSYVLSEDEKSFRFLTIPELFKIFKVPSWFRFPETIGKIRKYEMIGQSVCGHVFQAIANRIAEVFFRNQPKKEKRDEFIPQLSIDDEQLGFVF